MFWKTTDFQKIKEESGLNPNGPSSLRTIYQVCTTSKCKVSLLEAVALWGDCTMSMGVIVADLCFIALSEDFSL